MEVSGKSGTDSRERGNDGWLPQMGISFFGGGEGPPISLRKKIRGIVQISRIGCPLIIAQLVRSEYVQGKNACSILYQNIKLEGRGEKLHKRKKYSGAGSRTQFSPLNHIYQTLTRQGSVYRPLHPNY
jgi:hypothetical protein